MNIKQADWKNKPMTGTADKIDLELTFDKSEFEKIKDGHKPNDMDGRWLFTLTTTGHIFTGLGLVIVYLI